ncbi:MAG: hypothetical protein JWO53_795, partial [Chlamydiia bacterium]|nr:hypothetical protein [Chlamydiia bacterium]
MQDSFATLFLRSLQVRVFNLKDFLRTVLHYYYHVRFACVDLSLLFSYFWKSPYRISWERDKE